MSRPLIIPHEQAMIDPLKQRAFVPIPKNASNSIIAALRAQGWWHVHLPNPRFDVKELIVVLRDPIQRWVSGMAQFIRTTILDPVGHNGPVFDPSQATLHDYAMTLDQFQEQYTDLVERIIFDQCDRFDEHVWPQCDWLPDLPNVPRRYIIMDQDFAQKTTDIFQVNLLDLNNSDDNWFLKNLQKWFRQRLLLRPELEQRIRERYQRDYDLIKQAHDH